MDHVEPAGPKSKRSVRHASWLAACTALTCLTCHAEATPPDPVAPLEAPALEAPPDAAVSAAPVGVLAIRAALVSEAADVVVARADAAARDAAPDEAAMLKWLAAAHDPDAVRAEARFAEIAAGSSPLAGWAAIEAARRALSDDPRGAHEALARATAAAPAGWPGLREVRALDALALAAMAEPAEGAAPDAVAEARSVAETALREALREPPSTTLDRSLRRALADLLAAAEASTARREAIGLYQDLLSGSPTSRAATGAREALDRAIASFPDDERAALAQPTLAQSRALAAHLEATQQHRAAADAHAAVAAGLEPGSMARCAALLDAGRALHRGRVHAAAIERLDAMLAECAPPAAAPETPTAELEPRRDALAWAHYALGRSALSSGQAPRAIAHLEAIGDAAPGHRLVDDGLVFAARARLERGEREQAHECFSRAIALGGDMRGEARFQLAWDLRARGQRAEALAELDASLAEGTGEAAEGIIGRAAYWRARVLVELDRGADARDALESVVRARPLTYYAQLALARLGELEPARRDAVRTSLLARRSPLDRANDSDATLLARSAARRAVAERLTSPDARLSFARAMALLAVDERERGERELRGLGLSAEGDVAAVTTLTALLGETGHAHRATDLARRRLGAELVTVDDAESLALYRLAYPQAYPGLFEDAAGVEDVDPSFVRAIAREESSFDPDAVSVAHAYGLLQLIRPTAQRHGRSLGLPSDPGALCTPSVNVRIGARYIGSLRRRYDGQAALIPAAYNAGEGAVDRWIRERPEQPFDAWVEEIPYGETRGYTRRVIQSWIVYAFLDRGELPQLPAVLPRRG